METQFLQAYDAWADDVFRYCLFRLPRREQAQDVAQETFVRAWNQLVAGAEITNLRAFLYRVARNLIADEYRQKQTDFLETLAGTEFDPISLHDPAQSAELSLVHRVLDRLDEEDRELILLRHINGLPVNEIAEALGNTPNVISVRLHRALRKAKSLLT